MQLAELAYLLKHPESVSASQIEVLESEIKLYPYFQALRALLLKGLKQKGSHRYNNALKKTAAYTIDRAVLFNYITSDIFNQQNISLQINQNQQDLKALKVNPKDILVNKIVKTDNEFKQQIKDTKGVLDPNLFEKKSQKLVNSISNTNLGKIDDKVKESINVSFNEMESGKTVTKEDEKLLQDNFDNTSKTLKREQKNKGKLVSFNSNEHYSFAEWLKITTATPVTRKKEKHTTSETQEIIDLSKNTPLSPIHDKLEIIDRFIEINPKIKPIKQDSQNSITIKTDDAISESMMTETLARIYFEQKNYNKAIKAYKILRLKYPEKSSLFAKQIQFIKNLID